MIINPNLMPVKTHYTDPRPYVAVVTTSLTYTAGSGISACRLGSLQTHIPLI